MTTAVLPQSPLFTAPLVDFFKKHPRITIVTVVAFAVLGIAGAAAVSAIIASVQLAVLLGGAAALCLLFSAALGYFAVQQALASKNSISEVEDVKGSPPNIPLNDVAAQKAYRVQVMNDTLAHLKAGFYTSPDGTKHQLALDAAAAGAALFLSAGNRGQRPGNEAGLLSVKNKDCLYAAAELHAKGLNPIVLDMASDGHFGGGYLAGARAQEEDCCRRAGICLAADSQHGLQTRNFYPLSSQSPSAALYVPDVPIFRAGYDKGYQYLNRPFNVAFGAIAAFNSPPIDNSSGIPRLRDAEAETTREKIRTFFEMAHQKGHKSVVFGALGCGAFRNPPEHIAEIAMNVYHHEFKHCFQEVAFAVIDDHNAGAQGNFAPFVRQALVSGGKAFDANGQEITRI